MSGESATAVAFLAMSCFSLLVQLRALRQLTTNTRMNDGLAWRGLVRTMASRVSAAALYVIVGVNVLIVHFAAASVTFAVFCAVQILWQLNSRADVALKRKLSTEELVRPTGACRHRSGTCQTE